MYYEKGKRFHSPMPTLKSKKLPKMTNFRKYKINSCSLAECFFGFKQALVTSSDKVMAKQSVKIKLIW